MEKAENQEVNRRKFLETLLGGATLVIGGCATNTVDQVKMAMVDESSLFPQEREKLLRITRLVQRSIFSSEACSALDQVGVYFGDRKEDITSGESKDILGSYSPVDDSIAVDPPGYISLFTRALIHESIHALVAHDFLDITTFPSFYEDIAVTDNEKIRYWFDDIEKAIKQEPYSEGSLDYQWDERVARTFGAMTLSMENFPASLINFYAPVVRQDELFSNSSFRYHFFKQLIASIEEIYWE